MPLDSALKLEIELSLREFWQFEPIELDVTISVPDAKSKPVTIPNEIDPGYASFEIWITRPNQERHRYRPLKRFCGNPEMRQIRPGKPFTRDMSIGKQSGGFTFASAGKHQIQVVLQLSPGKSVFSNTLECEVLPTDPDSATYTAMRELFSVQDIVNFLRYKSRIPSRSSYSRLRQFAETHHAARTAADIYYCFGRGLLNSSQTEADRRRAHHLRRDGIRHLERAADHPLLSRHRSTIAQRLLSKYAASGTK